MEMDYPPSSIIYRLLKYIMVINKYSLGQLQTNCYLVYDQGIKDCLIIDPADDANFISEQILNLKVNPTAIIATHGHFDHILAAWELQLAFDTPFLIHKDDEFLLKNMQKSAKHFLNQNIIEKVPENIIFLARGGLASGARPPLAEYFAEYIEVIHIPGHSPGSICLYSKENNILFSGDSLFSDSVGRTDFSYGSKKDLDLSLKSIFKLPKNTLVYPGHQESFFLQNHPLY